MNRRETLKALGIGALGSSLLLNGCKAESSKVTKSNLSNQPGREAFEIERINRLNGEQFFNGHEMATIAILADIIIPKDDVSGSATDAGVPEFIEFIVKDMPHHQIPMRGGLRWLDLHCLNRFSSTFVAAKEDERIKIVDDIAYPGSAKSELKQGVAFFARMRDLTSSGFYTSEIGVEDIGYKGNVPNQWKGVPADVLEQYGLKSDII